MLCFLTLLSCVCVCVCVGLVSAHIIIPPSSLSPAPHCLFIVHIIVYWTPLTHHITHTHTLTPPIICLHRRFGMNGKNLDLVLDGEADALTLLSISLDGVDLVADVDYVIEGDSLIIPSSVLGGGDDGDYDGGAKKLLTTKVEIVPETNTQLSGLYKSGKMYCTQCEAMG